MPDQADHLRLLMHGAQGSPVGGGARLLVVAGAKGGVGTTTIALALAAASARMERATALVDGDLGKASLAAWCGAANEPTIVDVLSGRRRVDESLQAGPAGTRLLAGAWATGYLTDCDASAQNRLIEQLKTLSGVDIVVIDAGSGQHRIMERFWHAADDVLLVATPDDAAVMSAYGIVKAMAGTAHETPLHAVMNQALRHDDASGAYARLRNACRRFLAVELPCVANILLQAEAKALQRQHLDAKEPRVSQFTQTMHHLARLLAQRPDCSRSRLRAGEQCVISC